MEKGVTVSLGHEYLEAVIYLPDMAMFATSGYDEPTPGSYDHPVKI